MYKPVKSHYQPNSKEVDDAIQTLKTSQFDEVKQQAKKDIFQYFKLQFHEGDGKTTFTKAQELMTQRSQTNGLQSSAVQVKFENIYIFMQ